MLLTNKPIKDINIIFIFVYDTLNIIIKAKRT